MIDDSMIRMVCRAAEVKAALRRPSGLPGYSIPNRPMGRIFAGRSLKTKKASVIDGGFRIDWQSIASSIERAASVETGLGTALFQADRFADSFAKEV
jgi:hypothetical protein